MLPENNKHINILTMDRFELEEAITSMLTTVEELETILYKIGDSPTPPTEDELANMLIGVIDLSKARHDKLWNIFETLVRDKVITSKNIYTNLTHAND
jgi:hypothetical protein